MAQIAKEARNGRIVLPTVDPVCPAALPIAEAEGGTGCRCRITHSNVLSLDDRSSLARYCWAAPSDGPTSYQDCPVWRRDKAHAQANKTNRPLVDPRSLFTKGDREDQKQVEADKAFNRALMGGEGE